MTSNFESKIPNLLTMIRPNHCGFNEETAATNSFQQVVQISNLQELAQEQFDKVVEQLRNADLVVHVFEDQEILLPDAVFSNNWIVSLPTGVTTIFPVFSVNRRDEVRQDVIDWIKTSTKTNSLIDLTGNTNDNRFLEGTGSIVFDHFTQTAFASESPRTDIKLFEAYCDTIGYTPFSFESVDLMGNPIYHTNVVLSIAENYVLVNLESVQNQLERSFLKLRLETNGKIVIELTYPQMNHFAANVLEVLNVKGESCLVMSETAYKSLRVDQIEKIEFYSKIITVDVSLFEQVGGGGIRCMLTGLFC